MARHCTTATLAKQLPKQEVGQQLSEWRKRLQLLEGEKKANYEEGEEEKKRNIALIQSLKKDIRIMKEKAERSGKNELLMRDALEGMATASVAHQHVEPVSKLDSKNDRLGDLTNKLNKLRSVTAKKRQKLASIMATFEDAVVDNIVYEENRQPDEVHVRDLNNRLDCMSKKLLEAQMVRDKYRGVVSSLRAEQMTYASRLQLMQRRLGEAAGARSAVTRAEQYAASVRETAQSQLSQSQQLSSEWRQERDSKLNEYKRQAEKQRSEYLHLRRQLYLGGTEHPLQSEASSGGVKLAPNVSQLVSDQLHGLYEQAKQMMESLGARTIDDVVKLFEMQADTSRQLTMVWKDTENNIKTLKKKKQDNELEIEKLKYADNLEEIRMRNQCLELRETIEGHLARKKVQDDRVEVIIGTLSRLRAGLTHMVDQFQENGLTVLKLPSKSSSQLPPIAALFEAVHTAVQFVMEPMQTVNVPQMMLEMDAKEFSATKSELDALDHKVRGVPPIRPPGKKRFSFLLLDRPDVIDEGPSVLTRAQMKRHAQVMIEARQRKIRPPTSRDLRKTRRRSTVIDRGLQAMF
ncbi:outer dynein arm-docking complex subunit 3-like isoform X2 [Amphibalanus amphitrite]|uniref:outer dynein arm-docking complex subunit 3-like isoform X2 n=1 Tax=Amphibalanus amphitrite TaxID=1232801 RepID=UPI001C92A49F|nr:outer dynein arm-docking complex subunit 3-like isoform X2 [Amphibalanus amphitrite]